MDRQGGLADPAGASMALIITGPSRPAAASARSSWTSSGSRPVKLATSGGLAARAVQRHHQQAGQPLLQRLRGHQPLQLGHQPITAASVEVGLDAVLHHRQAALLQPGALPGQGRHLRVLERPAPPQRQGGAQQPTGLLPIPGGEQRTALVGQVLEPRRHPSIHPAAKEVAMTTEVVSRATTIGRRLGPMRRRAGGGSPTTAPAAEPEHELVVLSRHRTSEGVVTYAQCNCGDLQIWLTGAGRPANTLIKSIRGPEPSPP